MYLSALLEKTQDSNVIEIINEQAFDRFSRTTSVNEGKLCVFIASEKYLNTIPSNATMIITKPEIREKIEKVDVGICVSRNPKVTFFRLFSVAAKLNGINEHATIIGENCHIGKYVNISKNNVIIGRDVTIEDFVTIYENVKIGDNCIIRSGARLGVQDYNYFLDEGKLVHLPHYGELIISNDVEIGFNSVVGRSLYPGDSTIIGEGTKLANCCAIGHDCILGKRVMIYAGTMIAGYVVIGDDTHITLNSSIKNGVKIGKNVQVDMGSVVIRDVEDNEIVFGNPARKVITPK